jgi:hypothetical protein
MQYLAREAGYADPQPIDPEDQEAELQRTFIDAVSRLEGIQKQLQRVQQMVDGSLHSAASSPCLGSQAALLPHIGGGAGAAKLAPLSRLAPSPMEM